MNKLVLIGGIVIIIAIIGVVVFSTSGGETEKGTTLQSSDTKTPSKVTADKDGNRVIVYDDVEVKFDPGTIVGRVVDQHKEPITLWSQTGRPLYHVLDTLGEVAHEGNFLSSYTIRTTVLNPGEYSLKLPFQEFNTSSMSETEVTGSQKWLCACFPIIQKLTLPDDGLNLGDVVVQRFAHVTFQELQNEVGTTILDRLHVRVTDAEIYDDSLRTTFERRGNYKVSNYRKWEQAYRMPSGYGVATIGGKQGGYLPPGKYTIEVNATTDTYEPATISFEVGDQDIDLGVITLKKK